MHTKTVKLNMSNKFACLFVFLGWASLQVAQYTIIALGVITYSVKPNKKLFVFWKEIAEILVILQCL